MDVAEDYTRRLRDVFDLCDIEKKGFISVDHFVQLAQEHFGASDQDASIQESISQIVNVLDPDGRGQIHFVQFCEGVKQVLKLQALSVPPSSDAAANGQNKCYVQEDADILYMTSSPLTATDNDLSVDDPYRHVNCTVNISNENGSPVGNGDTSIIEPGQSRLKGTADGVEWLLEENLSDCSLSDPPRLVHTSHSAHRSHQNSPLNGRLLTTNAIASHLYHSNPSLANVSRQSSMSDVLFEDIDGSFLELNDKVKTLENQVRELTETQRRSDERQVRLKEENGQLVERVHMLEEQLKEIEIRSAERLAEEQRRNKEYMNRTEKDRSSEIEVLTQSYQHIEKEYLALKDELPILRAENDRLRKEGTHQSLEIDRLQQQMTELTAEHMELKEHTHQEHMKRMKERQVHAQLVDELSRELEELRNFKAEYLSRSPSSSSSDLSLTYRMQLEAVISHLKQENVALREQSADLQGQMFNQHLQEGQALLQQSSACANAPAESLSRDELLTALRLERESNLKLRDYVERITLRILEKNPSILEVASMTK